MFFCHVAQEISVNVAHFAFNAGNIVVICFSEEIKNISINVSNMVQLHVYPYKTTTNVL